MNAECICRSCDVIFPATADRVCPACKTRDRVVVHFGDRSESPTRRATKRRRVRYRFVDPSAYAVAAVPTTYAGVNFDSRLDATWAAFFDLVGWLWDYQPRRFLGWTPDFCVAFRDLRNRLHTPYVDVKPWTSIDAFVKAFTNAHGVFRYIGHPGPYPASLALGERPEIARLLPGDGTVVDDMNVFIGTKGPDEPCVIFCPEDVTTIWKRAKNIVTRRSEEFGQ